jgi:hypothetical protein
MSVEGKDDYSAGICFGEWLRSQRTLTGLLIEASAKRTTEGPLLRNR